MYSNSKVIKGKIIDKTFLKIFCLLSLALKSLTNQFDLTPEFFWINPMLLVENKEKSFYSVNWTNRNQHNRLISAWLELFDSKQDQMFVKSVFTPRALQF